MILEVWFPEDENGIEKSLVEMRKKSCCRSDVCQGVGLHLK